jgi:hypothetical protein
MDTPRYLIVQAGFVLLTLLFISLLILEFRKAARLTGWNKNQTRSFLNRIMVTLLLWAVFVSAWSLTGRMADFSMFPLNFLPVIGIPVIIALIFIPSKKIGEIVKHIPPENLIRLQSFRFFVEVLLWMLFLDSLVPVQMTFEGRNFDILSGLSAPVIAILVAKGKVTRTGVVIWNILCLGLLLNIVITAILSTPSPWRVFMNEPANYIVARFPISWLPGFLVPLAYYLHFLSLRQMGRNSER